MYLQEYYTEVPVATDPCIEGTYRLEIQYMIWSRHPVRLSQLSCIDKLLAKNEWDYMGKMDPSINIVVSKVRP